MNKIIYLTETQLKEIVGNGSYLNTNDDTNEYKLGGMEVSLNGYTGSYLDGDQKNGKPITTDKIAKQIARPRVRGLGRTVLPESNQDLTGKQHTMQISKSTIDDIKKNLNNYCGPKNEPGVKRAQKIVKDGRITNDNGYRILNDFANNKTGNVLDDKLAKEIRRKLDTAENISKTNRANKIARGENVLKSSPKTGMKGGAHTPKGNNIINVTYEN